MISPSVEESPKDYTDGWKVMREKTSSASRNGLHFGHMKACTFNSDLAEFESSILHIPYATGYAPPS